MENNQLVRFEDGVLTWICFLWTTINKWSDFPQDILILMQYYFEPQGGILIHFKEAAHCQTMVAVYKVQNEVLQQKKRHNWKNQ